jgi:hypothetical protein
MGFKCREGGELYCEGEIEGIYVRLGENPMHV